LTAIKDAEPKIMRAAQRGTVHKNTASRKVSRLVHRIAKLAKYFPRQAATDRPANKFVGYPTNPLNLYISIRGPA
jgi:hypothetical protein